MPKIFISYRREDSAGFAGRLSDALETRFGAGNVFRDIEDIRPGEDFMHALERALASTEVVIPLIGTRWLASGVDGRRRLDDPNDTLRLEIRTALHSRLRVIPALVEGATMPAATQLPQDIAELARRQAVVLDDRTWDADVEALSREIDAPGARLMQSPPGVQPPALTTPARTRRRFAFGLLALAALAAGAGLSRYMSQTLDLSGAWRFEDGNMWYVQQDGNQLTIDESHHDTREIWRSGKGSLRKSDVDIDLHYMFNPGVRLTGTLRVSDDGRSMAGTVTEQPGARSVMLSLRR